MRASLRKMFRDIAFAAAAALLLSGCFDRPAPTEGRPDEPKGSGAIFVNKVWRVSASSSVAPGTLYVFLAEGTLIVASANGKPAMGTWRYESDALTMVEEGIAYKADILKLSKDEFRIRSHNPGKSVEIALVPANGPPQSK